MTECVLYWLHDERCICLQKHGYVGITTNWVRRLSQHQNNKRFPVNFEWSIIFTGTRAECLVLEHQLRPESGIGWNRSQGGKPVIEFTDEVRINMRKSKRTKEQIVADRAINKNAKTSPEKRLKYSIGGMGFVRSEESKAKQSASTKGKKKSAEHRVAQSEAAKRRYERDGGLSEEIRRKIGESQKRRLAARLLEE